MNNQPKEVLMNTEDIPKTITKTVLRAFCIKNDSSSNLDEKTLYYMEPHNKTHYFVSKFPSAKTSHMGVYSADRFKVVREEVVEVDNPAYKKALSALAELEAKENEQSNEIDNEPVLDNSLAIFSEPALANEVEIATFDTGINELISNVAENPVLEPSQPQEETLPSTNAVIVEKAVEEEETPLKTVKELPFAQHYNVQGDDEEPPFTDTHRNLEHEVLYEAKVVYRRPSYAMFVELGTTLYIKRPNTNYAYYHKNMCHVYTDAQGEVHKGALPLNYFDDFKIVENVEEIQNSNNAAETTATVEATAEMRNDEVVSKLEQSLPVLEEVVESAKTVDEATPTVVSESIETITAEEDFVQEVEQIQEPILTEEAAQEETTNNSSSVINLFDMPLDEITSKKRKKNPPKEDPADQLDLFAGVFF
ncbi:hypothetical protein [Solibacillus sp. NPDC093137]|uniref:hypothetical protein n=1 Tax=Solibacillus sp. NPDC093137 TaxID=3390678 RepID=UPI003D08F0E4